MILTLRVIFAVAALSCVWSAGARCALWDMRGERRDRRWAVGLLALGIACEAATL